VKRHSVILERLAFDNTSLAPTSGISVGPVTASVPSALPTGLTGNMASSKVTAGMFPHLHLATPTQRQTIIEDGSISWSLSDSITDCLYLPSVPRNSVELNRAVNNLWNRRVLHKHC